MTKKKNGGSTIGTIEYSHLVWNSKARLTQQSNSLKRLNGNEVRSPAAVLRRSTVDYHSAMIKEDLRQEEMREMEEVMKPECHFQSNDEHWMVLLGGGSIFSLSHNARPSHHNSNPTQYTNNHYHGHASHNDLGDGYDSDDDTKKEDIMLWTLPIQLVIFFFVVVVKLEFVTFETIKQDKGLLASAKALLKGSNDPIKRNLTSAEIQSSIKSKPYELYPVQISIQDSSRAVDLILMAPDGRYAALTDSLGRISIFDCTNLILLRVFKGHRHAQIGWIYVNPDVVELTTYDIAPRDLKKEKKKTIATKRADEPSSNNENANADKSQTEKEEPPTPLAHTTSSRNGHHGIKTDSLNASILSTSPYEGNNATNVKAMRPASLKHSISSPSPQSGGHLGDPLYPKPRNSRPSALQAQSSSPMISRMNDSNGDGNANGNGRIEKEGINKREEEEEEEEEGEIMFCNNQNRQILNDTSYSTHRRNILLLVIYVPTRGLLEFYSVACKKRLHAVTIFPKCKLIPTYNWSVNPPWPYLLFQHDNGKLFKLVVNPKILQMPYSKHNETNIVAPKKNFNVNEHLKYLSIRRNEEWKYYSKKMFRVVRNTFICHCFQSNTNVAALNTASPSSKHSFHTAIGKWNFRSTFSFFVFIF
ncbi:hypothetical protein RFI_30402 [Reticulomyxa filosa]|uniref:Rab3-GAP regulatory subunit N-terminal domain-containing protein n=1 Tax=Reticulomyxa filosa TaxID=46433 RepID=X6LZF5_RETFI|nr:hypothetical protein RFI_30402 [Reticulomyxa filosa]|eukprot:ETO06989.1 hypothetical protein RFI_30402 [Reticulomyxa filosa]